MSALIQFDLFEPIPTEVEMCKLDIVAVRQSTDKVRRKLFAENSELKRKCYELEYRLEILERSICN